MTTSPPFGDPDSSTYIEGSVPLRPGGACPGCGEEVLEVDFVDLPTIAIKREMYEVCVLETEDLPTPWTHRTAIAYHEDPSIEGSGVSPESPPYPRVD